MTTDRQRYPDVVLIDGSKEKRSNAGYGNFTLIWVPVIPIVEDPTETLRVPLVVQKLLTIPEHLRSPSAIVGLAAYHSEASEFTPGYLGLAAYQIGASEFTPGYCGVSCLPFRSIWVHPRLLWGWLLTIPKHLSSPSAIVGLAAYQSGASEFTPGYCGVNCLPFRSIWVHPWLLWG